MGGGSSGGVCWAKDTCQYWGSKRVSHPDGLNAPSVAVLWDERQVPALVLESRSES